MLIMRSNTRKFQHSPSGFKANSQKGFAQLALLLIMLVGIGVGTYVVQNRTNILPRADCEGENCDANREDNDDDKEAQDDEDRKKERQDIEKGAKESGKSVEEYRKDDCEANPGKESCQDKDDDDNGGDDEENNNENSGGNNPDDACANSSNRKDCERAEKSDKGCGDKKTYCGENGFKVVKTGGYWESNEGDAGACIYDYITLEDQSCGDAAAGTVFNEDREANEKIYGKSKECEQTTYCQEGRKYKKTAVGTKTNSSGDVVCSYDVEQLEGNGCEDKPDDFVIEREGSKRLSTNPSDTLTPDDEEIRTETTIKNSKMVLSSTKNRITETFGVTYTKGKSATDYEKECTDNGNAVEKCAKLATVLTGINEAEDDLAIVTSQNCSAAIDRSECEAVKDAALGYAKFTIRKSIADAADIGIEEANFVLDMGDSKNPVFATLADGTKVRVSIGCSSIDSVDGVCRKVLNYRDPTTGERVELPANIATQSLNIPNAGNISDLCSLPENIKEIWATAKSSLGARCAAAANPGQSGSQASSGNSIPAGQPGSTQASASCTDREIKDNVSARKIPKACSECLLQGKYSDSYSAMKADLGNRANGCSPNDLLAFYASGYGDGTSKEYTKRTKGHVDDGEFKAECSASCGTSTGNASTTTNPSSSSDTYLQTLLRSDSQCLDKGSTNYRYSTSTKECEFIPLDKISDASCEIYRQRDGGLWIRNGNGVCERVYPSPGKNAFTTHSANPCQTDTNCKSTQYCYKDSAGSRCEIRSFDINISCNDTSNKCPVTHPVCKSGNCYNSKNEPLPKPPAP